MKPSRIFILMAMLLPFGVFAQDSDRESFKEEMKAYRKANVMPVLIAQRQKLEGQLSASDKAKLSSLRNQHKLHKESTRALKQEIREARETGATISDAQKIALFDAREDGRSMMQATREIAKNNEETLKTLFDEIEADREKWREDIKAIREKYRTEDAKEGERKGFRGNGDGKKHRKGHGHKGEGFGKGHGKRHGKMGMGKGGRMRPEAFLLWDPDAREQTTFEEEEETIAFPNPSYRETNIRFGLQQTGKVQITLMDDKGKVVREVLNKELTKGPHQVSLDTKGLQNGVYFYKIVSLDGIETKRIVVEK